MDGLSEDREAYYKHIADTQQYLNEMGVKYGLKLNFGTLGDPATYQGVTITIEGKK